MDLELDNKVVVVTGGASGIGEAISRAFAAEGAEVVIAARRMEQANSLVNELREEGHKAHAVQVELTDEQQCVAAFEWVGDALGRVDILVNNAGVNDSVDLEQGADAFRMSLEKNLVQVYQCAHCALPFLSASKGNIVNVGSKVARTGQGGTSGYAASKGGMDALTREWALDLSSRGIRVNSVIPAEVITPLYLRWLESTTEDPNSAIDEIGQLIPLGRRTTTPEEIAHTVVFVASPKSSHTTGQILYVDGGYTHLDRAATGDDR
ncbi:MAG: SDR family oxidoreductase [Gammaproteobacteria bacterium]|nr:SDR family oxidoreductase [Gammaproteobacteria bacterium]